MIVFPHAKINLGLYITRKLSNGYHSLETLFYPIPLEDVLEVLPRTDDHTEDELLISGVVPEGNPNDNLVLKAVRAMRETAHIPPLQIALHKHIPAQAGMGGGSADATAMLRLLRDEYAPQTDYEQIANIAKRLGADCPFFLYNTACVGRGIGEILTPMPEVDLSGYHILVVKPPIAIRTAEAFGGLKHLSKPPQPIEDLVLRPICEWKDCLCNDFETSLFPIYPAIAEIKTRLYDHGAIYASMSGSGSAVYGIFAEKPQLRQEDFANCFVWQTRL